MVGAAGGSVAAGGGVSTVLGAASGVDAAGVAVGAAAAGLGSVFTTRGGKFTSQIAPVGHTATHFRQSLHLVKSMYARLFSTTIASKGHSF